MGSLMQLLALPAACMLFSWMGRGGADAIASLLRNFVAMIAVDDTARARVAPGFVAQARAAKAARGEGPLDTARKGAPKDNRSPRNALLVRTGKVAPLLRIRRLRPRLAAGSAGI